MLVVGPSARLPTVSLPDSEPLVPEILSAVDFVNREALVVLRQVMTWTTASRWVQSRGPSNLSLRNARDSIDLYK